MQGLGSEQLQREGESRFGVTQLVFDRFGHFGGGFYHTTIQMHRHGILRMVKNSQIIQPSTFRVRF